VTDGQTDGQNYDSQDRASIARTVKWELFFIKYGVKVNGQYYWDILLIPYYLNKC